MEAFATVADLKAGGRDLPIDDAAAEVVLRRASAYLAAMLSRHGVEVDESDEVMKTNLCTVTCNMAFRSLSQGSMSGLASASQGIGSTSVSVVYRDPDGSFYLSKSDKELLGITGRGGFRMLRPAIRASDGSDVEGW